MVPISWGFYTDNKKRQTFMYTCLPLKISGLSQRITFRKVWGGRAGLASVIYSSLGAFKDFFQLINETQLAAKIITYLL